MDDNSSPILRTLLEIKEDIGIIKATLAGTQRDSDNQENRTNNLMSRVNRLEDQQARWKWTTAGFMGALVGFWKIIEVWWTSGSSHH
jgi:hypothetical protein